VAKFLDIRFFYGHCINCGIGRMPRPIPPPSPPLILQRSVGKGGVNIAAEVQAVQARLNAVPRDRGGPVPLLAVDGIVGEKTIAAILRFQHVSVGVSDGRIDPGGPTLARLNAPPVAAPVAVSAAAPRASVQQDNPFVGLAGQVTPIAQIIDNGDIDFPMIRLLRAYIAMMPTIRAAIMSARRRLSNIERYITDRPLVPPNDPGFDRERHNIALLEDCFGLSQFPDPRHAYHKIRDVFETMSRAAVRCRFDGDPATNGLIAPNEVAVLNNPLHETAYVLRSGFHTPFEEFEHPEHPGHLVRSDRVYITKNSLLYFGHKPLMIGMIIHELAHWVSRPNDDIPDQRRGNAFWDDRPFRELPPANRISSAENYGWFGARSYIEPFAF
jgi:hypothetical protein